ncbi:MocR-like pyridoxine biosynthesis transcription factor PdxR [Microlunatus ginsengisoli]|uniref:PLP-dependent aminotransferase family protein n=1 Tax=Microlunatus ginsengisoli TaxID=363863 RepID=A0ABP6ZNP5_9ACTN
MADSRANSTPSIAGVDLHLDVDVRRPRAGLERALRSAVQNGRLVAGTRLPASRTLAADLGIARNTVAEAYAQLVAEGWLTARQGSGTRVAARPHRSAPRQREQPAVRRSAQQARRPRFDLRPGVPDLAAFPRAGWSAAQRRALAGAPHQVFGYDPIGPASVRQAVAGYLARTRGVETDPGRIVLTSGFTQGLRVVAGVLADRGHASIGIEAYGHDAHRRVLLAAGLAPRPLSVDAHGARVEDLPCTDARAVVLTPAHQFPLGAVLSARRRQTACGWAAGAEGYVIEDDYDGEFRYDRQPVGAMQALDPERVVYAGSVSKTLVPGVRVGWLVLPDALVDDVVAAKSSEDAGSGVLDQLTVAELIRSGDYDRIVRRMRLTYRRRRDRLVSVLAEQAPDTRVSGIAAGLHALVELPARLTEDGVVAAAAARGLALEGLRTFAGLDPVDRTMPPALVVGYSRPADHAYTGALARLVAALSG